MLANLLSKLPRPQWSRRSRPIQPSAVFRSRTIIRRPTAEVFDFVASAQGLRMWLAHTATIENRVGGAVHLTWIDPSQGTLMPMTATIVELEECRRFSFQLSAPGGGAARIIRFELKPHPRGTALSVSDETWQQSGSDSFLTSVNWAKALDSLNHLLGEER
jgi:uncharacterized protein YndB with AHSA1/START domain